LRRSRDDPYVVCEVTSDGVGLVGPLGWVALHTEDDGRAGATAVLDTPPDQQAGAALSAAIEHLAAERGHRLTWLTTPDGAELPLAARWQRGGHWVWMSTRRCVVRAWDAPSPTRSAAACWRPTASPP